MKRGNLVYYVDNKSKLYVVLGVKKYYHGFHDRVRVLCPARGLQYVFIKEDLEVLNGNESW